jgi:amidase
MSYITRRGLFAASAAVSVSACAAPLPPPIPGPTTNPIAGWTPDATEIAARIRRGDVTALEVMDAAIARAQAMQPKLNFLVTPDFDRARDAAKRGGQTGPFAGVPFLVKDLNDVAGLPTHNGARYTAGAAPATVTDPFVQKALDAGLIEFGKTATPEHGFLPTTEPLAYGPTRNPWNLERSTGGSSGGSAAAVASGVVPMAHANDGGGSIRIPASNCGLFGLKPSRGRTVQKDPDVAITDLAVELCVSRSVRDSAGLLAVTEKAGPLAPVGLVTGPSTRRLRVGLLRETGVGRGPDAQVTAALESSAKLMSELGHSVRETHWPIDGVRFAQDFLTLWSMGAADLVKQVGKPELLEPFTVEMARSLARLPADATNGVVERLTQVAQQYDGWFNDFDVILSPVLAHPPVPLGYVRGDVPFEELSERLTDYVGYTPLHNVAGAPAMSVPLNWTADGLPVGSMFAARKGDERTLLELAYELERARPWGARRPPVSVS